MRHPTIRGAAAGLAAALALSAAPLVAALPGVPGPASPDAAGIPGAPAAARAQSTAAAQQSPSAGEPSPVEVIRQRNRKVQRILDAAGDSIGEATRERLKDVINGLFDFRELSRRALGKYWDERTEEEKREFVEVFRQLIRNSSVKKLGIHRADSLVYRPPELEDGEARVTTVAHKGRKTVEIVYEMHRVDGEWKAYDMVIDGASTVRSYRDSFYREISATSYEDTYQRLVEKLEEQRAEQTASG